MYKSKKVLMLLAVLIFSASSLFAQDTQTGTVNVNITILESLQMVYSGPLDFGEVALGSTSPVTAAPISFHVTGQPGKDVFIDYDQNVLLTGPNSDQLAFDQLVYETGTTSTFPTIPPTPIGDNSSHTLDALTGEIYFWLGGQITLPATTSSGLYTSTYSLTVAY